MFRPTSDILTTARDAIFMELRELRLRIFHPPRAAFALISRHLSSPSSMTSDDLCERSLRRRLGVVCEETHVRATIDGIDLLRASPRGKPALKEAGEESRTLRKIAFLWIIRLGVCGRQNKEPPRERTRTTERTSGKVPSLSPFLPLGRGDFASLPSRCPLFLCET